MTKAEFQMIFNIDNEELEKLITLVEFHFSDTENMFDDIAKLDIKGKNFEPGIIIVFLEDIKTKINTCLGYYLQVMIWMFENTHEFNVNQFEKRFGVGSWEKGFYEKRFNYCCSSTWQRMRDLSEDTYLKSFRKHEKSYVLKHKKAPSDRGF